MNSDSLCVYTSVDSRPSNRYSSNTYSVESSGARVARVKNAARALENNTHRVRLTVEKSFIECRNV